MPSAGRDVLEAVDDAITALTGWTKSKWTLGQFGKDPQRTLHKAYALGLPDTDPDPRDSRQVTAQGIVAGSALVLSWAYQLRGDSAPADYMLALDGEQALLLAVLGASNATHHSLTLTGATRDDTREGWLIGTARFTVTHRYGLTS